MEMKTEPNEAPIISSALQTRCVVLVEHALLALSVLEEAGGIHEFD